MKTIFLCLFISVVSCSFAQSNLTIFNNGDQSFYIILNGIKQNQIPQKNVCVSSVSNGGHALKVVFANGASADIDKKLYLDNPSDIRMEIQFKKGIGKLKIISYVATQGVSNTGVVFRPNENAVYTDAPVVQSQNQTIQNQSTTQITSNQVVPQNSQTATITTQNAIPNNSSQTITTQNPQTGINSNSSTSTTTTTTTTVTTTGNATIPANTSTNLNGGVNINMGLNGMNMTVTDPLSGQNVNMNMNVNGLNGANTTSTSSNSSSQSTTTTVTSISQSTSNSIPPNTTITTQNTNTTIPTNTQLNTNSQTITTNGNSTTNANGNRGTVTVIRGTAKINCSKTLGNIDAYINELKELSFEDDQVEAIEKDLVNTCLTSVQSYKIVELLTFESNRLDIAKFLSDRMINRDKAGELLPLFTFDSNKVEYKEYIR